MPQGRYQQLLLSRNMKPTTWESQTATNTNIDDLDHLEIIRTLKEGINKDRIDPALDTNNINDILIKFHLLDSNKLNNAAVLLYSKEIPGPYLQCVLRLAKYRGIKKENLIDSHNFFGNAFQILHEAEAFIKKNIHISSRITEGQLARDDQPEYPYKAIREALINAVCHRDYSSPSGSITIIIYDDRLEIANTGTLPDGITLNELQVTHTSHPRNPIIVNVMHRRGLIEALGSGTQLIINCCRDMGMQDPDFFEQSATFVVRMWSKHYKATEPHPDITKRQSAILNILYAHKILPPHEILSYLDDDITDRTLRNDLQALKDKQYVDSKGKGPKTQWYLLDNPNKNRK